MNARLSLARPARRRIQKLDRRSDCPDQRIRCRAVLKVAAGLSCNAAARELGCAPSTAVRIVARFGREGEAALLDARVENGSRKIDPDVHVGVCEILSGTPEDHGYTRPTWTLEILRVVVEAVLGVVRNLSTSLRHRLREFTEPRPCTGPQFLLRRMFPLTAATIRAGSIAAVSKKWDTIQGAKLRPPTR